MINSYKIYLNTASDRETTALALFRAGYTVRQGADKRKPQDTRKSSYIEFSEGKIDE